MAVEEQAATADAEETSADGERQNSTIAFPWADLDNAVRVAKGIHNKGGITLTLEQLAAELGVQVKGGGFRLMYSAAKIFGLVTLSQGSVTLTDLGRRINDPKAEKAAKAEAFLAVPLYRAIYESHKAGTLPPSSGLETEMASLGVVKKATERARQVFQKSAAQAGFLAYGTDRLVLPATGGAPVATTPPPAGEFKPHDRHKGSGGDDGGGRHPFIAGLLKELPADGTDWPTAERVKWLRTAATLFDWIYKNGDNNTRPVRIEVSSDSAK